MAYIVDPTVFENYWSLVVEQVCTTAMVVLLYGVFTVLFFLAVHLLHHRRAPGRRALLALTAAMALLATAQFALHCATAALALRLLAAAVRDGWTVYPPAIPTDAERLYGALALTKRWSMVGLCCELARVQSKRELV
ncbi:hypothetical protein B0H15DRAFT_978189 [Mycena belliarum]|uniref:Uncharacterized protein n=1 Tax=Mycena belliarum TaxID=1033014 RepID=A0AAD6UAG2_9AGAR|nr:hypothetical protein B0H15DRAFT_978189 [Mycena belliae]